MIKPGPEAQSPPSEIRNLTSFTISYHWEAPEGSKGDSQGQKLAFAAFPGTLRVMALLPAAQPRPLSLPLTLLRGWEVRACGPWRSRLLRGLETELGTVLSHGARALVLHLVSPKAPTM